MGMSRVEPRSCLLLALWILAIAVAWTPPADAQSTDATYDMEFRRTPIDDILRILADQYSVNIAINGKIGDSVTVNLAGMSIEEALDVLLEGSRWTWRHEGRKEDVYRVLPLSTPTTQIFELAYTNAANLAEVISNQVTEVIVNPEAHSNSLLVSGSLAAVREVGRLVASVDRYRAQVSIRAEMIEVTLNDGDTQGVDLSAILGGTDGEGTLSTDFGDGNDPSTLDVHTVQGDLDIRGVVAALNEHRESRLLSSPTITTLDNQKAKIHVGERVPYQRATIETQTGATLAEVEFVDVGVKLEVTPTVSEGEQLYLSIHSEVSEVLEQSVQNIPRIGTREADTRVLVRAGDTVVIGGLMKDNQATVTRKVPLLGDIPLLGRLFRRDIRTNEKTEFLVFIRPQLLHDPSQMRPGADAQATRDEFPSPPMELQQADERR
jgi:type II secretory pathway component GspD/PulD (secretin)